MRLSGLCTFIIAITSCAPPQKAVPLDSFESDWTHILATQPEAFSEFMTTENREGWISFHQRDFKNAFIQFTAMDSPTNTVGQHRAAEALSEQYATLSRITEGVTAQYFATVHASPTHALSAVGQKIYTRSSTCSAQESGSLENLIRTANAPLHVEVAASGIEILWYDPCVYHHLAQYWQTQKQQTAPKTETSKDSLAWTLFSSPPFTQDSSQSLPEHLQVLAQQNLARSSHGTPQGLALLEELSAPKQLEYDIYRTHAKRALHAREYKRASQHALLSFSPGQSVGPLVSQEALLVLAESQIKQQRYRDALQTLHVLSKGSLEVRTLLEWLGDLSVIKDIDREGDSKEN